MKTIIRSSSPAGRSFMASLLAFGYLSLALAPAYASDTEVYSTATPSAAAAPTVMLNLDASDNMKLCLNSTADCSSTPASTRLQALKNAMRKVLMGDSAASPVILPAPGHVRMGLTLVTGATTATRGAQVRFPVRRLDDPVAMASPNLVTVQMASGNQDAEQNELIGSPIRVGEGQLGLALEGALSVSQFAGLQFTNIRVPKGATITSAYLEVTADSDQTGDVRWEIAVQNVDDASEDFATRDIRSRTYTSPVSTHIAGNWVSNTVYQIPVTSLVQGIVDRSGWCGGQAMSFRIADRPADGNNKRTIYSYEGPTGGTAAAKRPKLVIDYSLSAAAASSSCMIESFTTNVKVISATDDIEWRASTAAGATTGITHNSLELRTVLITSGDKNQVGLRFQDVKLDNTVTLESATLALVGNTALNSQMQPMEIVAFEVDNLPPFCSTTPTTTCTAPTSIATTAPSVAWAPSKVVTNTTYTVDVTSLVKPVLQRAGWVNGNSLGLRIRNSGTTTKNASYYSFDGTASKAASLVLVGKQRVTSLTPSAVNTTTVRDEILAAVEGLVSDANAPVASGYIESARYLMGLGVVSDLSNPTTKSGSTYISPISSATQCSGNYMFLMSGGDPASASGVQTNTEPDINATACNADPALAVIGQANNPLTWQCMIGVSKHLGSTSNQKRTRVKTNTLILGMLDPTLNDKQKMTANMATVARASDGKAYTAVSEDELVNSLQETLSRALDEGATISAPGVAVNQLSRLTHLDQLYYSVFDPDKQAFWRGNVKRFRLGFIGSTPTVFGDDVDDGDPTNDESAVDSNTSFFKESAMSWWGPLERLPDGRIARNGGAAKVLPAPDARPNVLRGETVGERKMYTLLNSYPGTGSSNSATALQAIDLSNSTFNSNAKLAVGVTNDNTYARIMYWLLGYSVDVYKDGALSTDTITVTDETPLRREMGGALHSRPVLVNYGYSGDLNAALIDPEQQDNVAFFSTLEGVLHAVNTKTGVERFSFIPKEKLSSVATLAGTTVRVEPEYGMDLSWTVLREDKNNDSRITTVEDGQPTGDKVWLYGGMRMGGRNYYALDVTDRDAPKLKWALTGGSGAYTNMGQTWSQPTLGQVKIGTTVKTVLFFAGGYDPRHEALGFSAPGTPDLGSQIYIVDADTGELYWWAAAQAAGGVTPSKTVNEMQFSIPSEIKTFDYNSDGLVDTLYFGDLGGQVFRVDLRNGSTAANLGTRVRLLAKLGQTVAGGANIANQRRFYESPSVARFNDETGKYALVAIGSGYRSRPLQGFSTSDVVTEDYFYVLRDNDVVRADIALGSVSSPETATPSGDLQDTIEPGRLDEVIDIESGDGATGTGFMGWRVKLTDKGEKVLASPLIFNNKVFFTTYVPAALNQDPCIPIYGRTKLYEVGVRNAARVDTNGDGEVTDADQVVTDNVVQGLGGEAQLIVLPPDIGGGTGGVSGGGCGTIVLVGTKAVCGDDLGSGNFTRLRWFNKTKN